MVSRLAFPHPFTFILFTLWLPFSTLSPCSSRLKNKMWYGLLGSKELLQRSYRNLEERVHLEVSRKEGTFSWT